MTNNIYGVNLRVVVHSDAGLGRSLKNIISGDSDSSADEELLDFQYRAVKAFSDLGDWGAPTITHEGQGIVLTWDTDVVSAEAWVDAAVSAAVILQADVEVFYVPTFKAYENSRRYLVSRNGDVVTGYRLDWKRAKDTLVE